MGTAEPRQQTVTRKQGQRMTTPLTRQVVKETDPPAVALRWEPKAYLHEPAQQRQEPAAVGQLRLNERGHPRGAGLRHVDQQAQGHADHVHLLQQLAPVVAAGALCQAVGEQARCDRQAPSVQHLLRGPSSPVRAGMAGERCDACNLPVSGKRTGTELLLGISW